MIVIGIDPHEQPHTAVAVDGATGQVKTELIVRARRQGFEQLVPWARRLGEERLLAVEDCRHVSGGLERHLIARGERAVRVAPLQASSGASHRHRLNRRGNRQLNAALHRIAITQLRIHEPAKALVARRKSGSMSNREALRCLKRTARQKGLQHHENDRTAGRASGGLT